MVIIAILGPTATGKSDLGIALAQKFDGEIINADALQLYRGLDIGTGKVPPAQRGGVRHHLLDVLAVTDEASLAAYQRDVEQTTRQILHRGRTPIIVGGSGLYLAAALDELHIPPTDPTVRSRLERQAQEVGGPALHRRLEAVDPAAARRILPGNIRRIVRALEVIELTGRPFAASLPTPQHRRPTLQLGLRCPSPVLAERIEARVGQMWAAGLLAEVQHLQTQGLRSARTASRALGYAQALAQLDGHYTVEQAQAETVRLTKRLARRQRSWFGRDRRTSWLDAPTAELEQQATHLVAAHLGDGR